MPDVDADVRALLSSDSDYGLLRYRPLTRGYSLFYLAGGPTYEQVIRGIPKSGRYCTESTNSLTMAALSLVIFGALAPCGLCDGRRFCRSFSAREGGRIYRRNDTIWPKPIESWPKAGGKYGIEFRPRAFRVEESEDSVVAEPVLCVFFEKYFDVPMGAGDGARDD